MINEISIVWSTSWFEGNDSKPFQKATFLGKDWKKWTRSISTNQENLIYCSSSMGIYCSQDPSLKLESWCYWVWFKK